MKLTTRSEYALLALVHLSRQSPGVYLSAGDIASAQRIPRRFLEQILATLKQARVVKSQKGQRGGYTLAKAPEAITLAEIVRLLGGALAPTDSVSRHFYEPTPIEGERLLLEVFRDIRDHASKTLERTSLAQVS
jgi:Rrf2 family cysteine metabolism transcriptional repressor